MNSQQMTLFAEQESDHPLLYQGGSLVSLTAKAANVERLLTSVICGTKCGELLATLTPNGSWAKMYGEYCQVKMDGTLEEYSGTFPLWGTMSDGAVYGHPSLEPFTVENGLELLPTPVRSNTWIGQMKNVEWDGTNKHSMTLMQALKRGGGGATYLNPNFCELLMGFPIGWTELSV